MFQDTSNTTFTAKDLTDPSLFRLNSVVKTLLEAISRVDVKATTVQQAVTSITNVYGGGGGGPIVSPVTFTTTAINNAIAALPANGGIVELASGTYAYDGKITMKDKVTIRGKGPASIIERSADVDDGYGIINVEGADVLLQDFLIEGQVSTSTKLLYSDFSSDPMNVLLTKNTSVWVKPGAERVCVDNVTFTHTGGYSILLDADSADIVDVLISNCTFTNNRPHLFGLVAGDIAGANGYGSWTGGILYRGDCRTLAGKEFAIRGLTVQGCHWRRNTGNCLWGHCYGFDTHHTNINFVGNDFEDCGLDGILVGNVSGGVIKGNTFHRIGYITQTDNDTPEPRFLSAKNAVGLDTSGYASGCTYDGNIFVSVNGEYIDADGLRDSSITNNIGMVPYVGDAQYDEDSVASFQSNGSGGNTTRGIQTGNTSQNGGGANVKITGNTLVNCGMSAVLLAFAKGCLVTDNRIVHPTVAAEVPIQLYSLNGAIPASEWHCYDNTIEANSIEYTGSNFCIAETGVGWAGTYVNRVFNNRALGTNYGEFLRATNSASTTGFSIASNSPGESTATARSQSVVAREGSDSTAALKFYSQNIDTGVKTQIVQIADANHSINISNNGTAKTGAIGLGNRTTFAFTDVVAAGKLYGDTALVLTDTTLTYPNDTDLDLLNNSYGIIRYNSTSHVFEQSTSVSGGHRVWSSFGGGSVAGANKQVQFNDAGNMGASANLTYDKTAQLVTVTGIGGTAGIAVANAYVQADGGFYVTNTNTNTDAVNVPSGGVTGKWLIATDSIFLIEESAPSLSSAGQSRIYMDSTTHKARISQDGGAYADIVGTGVAGSNKQVQFNDVGSMGASADLTFDKTAKLLTVTGTVSTAGVAVANAFIQSDGGFLVTTGNTSTTSINSPTGGISAKWLIATDSVFWIAESAPALSSAGQARIYLDSGTGRLRLSQNGGAYSDLGTSQWITSGSDIYYSAGRVGIGLTPTVPLHVTSMGGYEPVIMVEGGSGTLPRLIAKSDVRQYELVSGGGSTGTAGKFYLYDRNAAAMRFTVETNGNFGINDASPAYKLTVAGTASQAAIYATSGYIASAEGYYSPNTSYQTVNIPNGGLTGRSLHATTYTQLGQSAGAPSATPGNVLGNGTIYYDIFTNSIRAVVNGSWTTFGSAGVSSLAATWPLVVNAPTGAVTVSISSTPSFSTVTASTGFKTSVAAIDSAGRFIGNGVVCYAGLAGTGYNYIYSYSSLGGGSYVFYYRAGGSDTININGINYTWEGGQLTMRNGVAYNSSSVTVTTF